MRRDRGDVGLLFSWDNRDTIDGMSSSANGTGAPRKCQFCKKAAEWIIRGVDELTSEDVCLVVCNVHRGKTGRLGALVFRHRARLGARA